MLPDNILFSKDPATDLRQFLSRKGYSKTIALMDENTRNSCYGLISDALPENHSIVVASGEEEKNITTCVRIWDEMTTHVLDRHACVVVLGGGVLGDMGGFCASTYKRGIDFVLIPTTLLAQADASIGGKLGVDFKSFKNHIGVFQQPALTLLDAGFLKTLPQNELRSGYAEVIKHTLIADRAMWEVISQRDLREQSWDDLIRHSVEFKDRVTREDPKEKGLRKILNAGHTIGHALESHLLGKGARILHGEAIAVGLITEGFLSQKKGLLNNADLEKITAYILSVYGKIETTASDVEEVCRLIVQDKKNKGNKILCVLFNGIGDAKWDCEISLDDVREAMGYYQSRQI